MGDPKATSHPTSSRFLIDYLDDAGEDKVRVFGIKGNQRADFYKVSIAYSDGWKSVGTLVYSWPEAYEKAKAADRILRELSPVSVSNSI